MSKRTDWLIVQEAICRFPDSPSRQRDFVDSWGGIMVKRTGRHLQKSDRNYGRGRRARR